MNHVPLVRKRISDNESSFDVAALASARENDRYDLHTQHLNEQMVRVLADDRL